MILRCENSQCRGDHGRPSRIERPATGRPRKTCCDACRQACGRSRKWAAQLRAEREARETRERLAAETRARAVLLLRSSPQLRTFCAVLAHTGQNYQQLSPEEVIRASEAFDLLQQGGPKKLDSQPVDFLARDGAPGLRSPGWGFVSAPRSPRHETEEDGPVDEWEDEEEE